VVLEAIEHHRRKRLDDLLGRRAAARRVPLVHPVDHPDDAERHEAVVEVGSQLA
jgi:hypothetical protein